jgi:hypothetical protein
MNIPNKTRLYSEVARVVRRGGRFALFDVLAGPNQPIHFPVPWAGDQSYSFLLSPENTRALITQAGFREMRWMTGQDQELIAELETHDALGEDVPATVGLNPGLLYGAEGPRYSATVQRNSEEGRILLAMGVFERI